MSRPVYTVRADERLIVAERRIAERGISALPVIDTEGIVGVISRTDLLRAGRVHVTDGEKEHVLSLPAATIREHMRAGIDLASPETSLKKAARHMVATHVHRVFVAERGRLLGVIGTREMMRAALREHVRVPLADIMTSSVVTIGIDDSLALAVDRLAASHRWGLVVVADREWPVGVFSQVEALAARDAPPKQRVEHWMNPAVLCLPAEMPAERAARTAIALGAPRIVAVSESGIRGVVSGTDFARLVADAP